VSKHVNSDIVIAELDSSSAGGQLADMEFTRGLVIIIKHGSVKIRNKNQHKTPFWSRNCQRFFKASVLCDL